jgi:hypothetical protein
LYEYPYRKARLGRHSVRWTKAARHPACYPPPPLGPSQSITS